MNNEKILLIIGSVILFLILMGFSYIMGFRENKPPIIITTDDPKMLIEAIRFHGLNTNSIDLPKNICLVNSEGTLYFIRDKRWCALYNRSFRDYYMKKKIK